MNEPPKSKEIIIPPLPPEWYFQSYKVLAGNRLAIIGSNKDFASELRRSLHGDPVSETQNLAENAKAKIWVIEDEKFGEGPEFEILDPCLMIDHFLDGRWVVSYARSDGKSRTRILKAVGKVIGHLELGDGIGHLKVDDEGGICVGWFDEGIYGNDCWKFGDEPWPPSSSGMAVFNSEGELLRKWKGCAIDDCYALNVVGSEVWACTYTDFPIIKMSPSGQNIWKTKLSGINAIAVDYPYVIAAGGYREDLNQVQLIRLEETEASILASWRIPQLHSRPQIPWLIDGRADRLHVVVNNIWHQWDVTQFVDQFQRQL